jgi:hypothetical protein
MSRVLSFPVDACWLLTSIFGKCQLKEKASRDLSDDSAGHTLHASPGVGEKPLPPHYDVIQLQEPVSVGSIIEEQLDPSRPIWYQAIIILLILLQLTLSTCAVAGSGA